MTNTELGFSAMFAAFIALPAVAKLSAAGLEWLFSKKKAKHPEPRSERVVLTKP